MTTYVTQLWFNRGPKTETEIIIVEAETRTAYECMVIAREELLKRVPDAFVTKAFPRPKGWSPPKTED